MNATVLILIIVAVLLLIAVAALGVVLYERKRSERLREHFGAEYDRRVAETGDRDAAEAELLDREHRRGELDVRNLTPEEHNRFRKSWDELQRSFVDAPEQVLNGADRLVTEIMRRRGYPVDDFDRRADDISVDHPGIVRDYREARATRNASASAKLEVDTEQRRKALTAYRSLVEALLDHEPRPHPAADKTGRSTRERTP